MNQELIIFDTTLRDGEQSPGASMNLEEKVRIAQALERLGVNVIEAGFPAASPGDFAAVEAVAKSVKNSSVCGLARALDSDIDACGRALATATMPRIHTFIATSPIHMQKKLNMSPEQVLERAEQAIKKALSYTDDVEFSAEDAGRSEFDFLCRIVERAIQVGAKTINIPDTVGYNLPHQFGDLIGRLIEYVPNSDKAVFSVHCHNDLGLATANSLSAVLHGARQVECTINGLGERAGNAALEEIVMAVRTRRDVFDVDTRLDTTQIMNCSRLVASTVGFPVQPNKAIVGANAFAHESGIHQDGVLKQRETYEIMRAEDVGLTANNLVLGKHSGRNALKQRLEELGVTFESQETLNEVFGRFKDLADKKHDIYDEDLLALVSDSSESVDYHLVTLDVCSHTGETPEATVVLKVHGTETTGRATGAGPVDAVFRAIESVADSGCQLTLYSVNNITTGTDAQGEVSVRLERDGRLVNGQGADTDIVIASAKAYLHALNRTASLKAAVNPQRL
jgi:2-isopropylmalate synthase